MPVPQINLVIFFVENPLASSDFYGRLFNLEPVEKSPTFAMFAFPNGIMLGLWSSKTAVPTVLVKAGGSEICFADEDVDGVYDQWRKLGIPMAQVPTDMDFGRTFVAVDPDGHRIRVYRTKEESDA